MRRIHRKTILKAVSGYLPGLLTREITTKRTFDPSKVIPLSGGLLQADASGFTKMSEELSRMGKKGAEELTFIFNRFFSAMLKIVFANGGDVLKFGGDSLLVYFEGKRGGWKAVATALEMQKKMRSFRSIPTSCGNYQLALHVGVNRGDCYAVSLGDPDGEMELAILGQNVNLTIRCNEAASPGEVLLTKGCYQDLENKVRISEKRKEFYKLIGLKTKPKPVPLPSGAHGKGRDTDRLLKALIPYLPCGIYQKIEADPTRSLVESEHRRITVLFLNLIYSYHLLEGIAEKREKSPLRLNDYFKTVQEVVADYGGVIARIDPYSDGDKVLVLFGAPVAQEDDEDRAILCSLKIREKLGLLEPGSSRSIKMRIGINTGNAFCGEVGSSHRKEYTVMGKDVNLAARLMSKADTDEVLVSEETFKAVRSGFKTLRLAVKAKGISQPVTAFSVENAVAERVTKREGKKGEKGEAPLIGRREEIKRIEKTITKVRRGRGQILSIVGEAGIGKSRLTQKLLELCNQRRMKGLLVDCHFYGINTPLLPWSEILKSYCGIGENDDPSTKEQRLHQELKEIDSVRWAPLFKDILGLSVPENEWTKSLDGERRRQILFDTMINLFLQRAKGTTTYLVFEDTHWMDQTSLDLLHHFGEKISHLPILLVLVHRPELKLEVPEADNNYERISLGELNQEDAFNLACCHLKIAHLPGQIEKLIWEKSRGNPLYLQELLHSLQDSGHLILNRAQVRYELSCEASMIEIPDTIGDVIMARIDKLDETARKVIKTASVIGRTFSFDTLATVLPFSLSGSKLRQWLNYLDKLDLVPLKGTQPSLQYMFKHALTQEVAYGLLPYTQKKNLHQRVGDHYEKKFRNSLEEKCELLAHHYEKSGSFNKAFSYLIKAGRKGQRGYSNLEAIKFFDKAEEIYRQDLRTKGQKCKIRRSSALRFELLESRGEVYKLIGDYSRSEKDFLVMLDLSRKAKNKAKQSKALNHLAELCWLRSDYTTSQRFVEKAHRISLSLNDDLGLAMCYNNFGDIHRRQGSFEEAAECYQTALRYYKKLEDSDGMARSYNNIGISSWSLGSLTEAARFFERALHVRREAGDKLGEAKTSNNLALIYQDRGDLAGSLEMLSRALEIFQKIGDKRNSGYCLGNMGTIFKSQARFSAALKAFEDSIQIFSEIGDEHALTYSVGNIGEVLLKMGELLEAKRCFDQTHSAAKILGDEELESETLSRFGEYHLLLGQLEQSEKYFKRALNLAEKIKSNEFIMKALAGLTELMLKFERFEEALGSSKRLLNLAQQENTREYVARAYLLSGTAKNSQSPLQQVESDLKKALQVSTEVGLQEIAYRVHLELIRLYNRLSEIEGGKKLALSRKHVAQAKRILENIAAHIENPGNRKKFLSMKRAAGFHIQGRRNMKKS